MHLSTKMGVYFSGKIYNFLVKKIYPKVFHIFNHFKKNRINEKDLLVCCSSSSFVNLLWQ